MKKKQVLFCGMMLCVLAATGNMAAAEEAYEFDINDYAVTGYTGNGGEIVVPEVLESCPVEIISSSVFYANNSITSVELPQTLLTLGNSNIYAMEELTKVLLPESLIVIDDYNFWECDQITEVVIPSKVTYIGSNSFNGCDNLRSIRFEGAVPFMESGCFEYLPEDVIVYVPDDQVDMFVEILPAGIQVQNTGVNAVVHDYVEAEEMFEFDDSTGTITSYLGFGVRVDIPESISGVPVTAIGDEAFYGNRYLYYVTIPEGVTYLGTDAFGSNWNLGHAVIPSTLKEIGNSAFGQYKGETVELPEGVEVIGDRAFYFSNANSVYFPTTIKSIGDEAFADSYVNYLYFEGTEIPEISLSAFDNLSITDVDLNWKASKEQMLSAQAFFDSIGQQSRVWRMQNPYVDYINDGLDYYENNVMTGYTGEQTHLRPWDLNGDIVVTALGDGAFKDNQVIEYFSVPYNDEFTTIGAEAFAGSSVQTVDLFDSVTTIGEGAFRDCIGLTEMVLPESVTSIGANAFEGCYGLKKLVLPSSPDGIDAGAFNGVDASVLRISDLATDEQVTAWNGILNPPWYDPVERESEYATITAMPYDESNFEDFWYDSEYMRLDDYMGYEVNIYLPREADGTPLTMLSANVLSRAKNEWEEVQLPVKSLVIPETVTEIVYGAFSNCPDLEVVICYAPLELVPEEAFANCTSLKQVVFVNGVRAIDPNAFVNCPALEMVYTGVYTERVDETAFDGEFDGFVTELPDIDGLLEAVKSDPIPEPETEEIEVIPMPELDVSLAGDYLGIWNGESMEEDGISVAFADLGMNVMLTLKEDGSAELLMVDETSVMPWFAAEECAYMGESLDSAAILYLEEEGRLCVEEDNMKMFFGREALDSVAEGETAVSDAAEGMESFAEWMDKKYVCTHAEVSGVDMDASVLGAEYAITFYEDETAEFVMAGVNVPDMRWEMDGDDLVMEYLDGTELRFVANDTGFELDFFGSMLMYFE